MNSAKDRVFQQFSVLSTEQSAKGVACGKAKTMQCYMAQRAERVDVHACKTLSSGLREASFWSKNGLRSNLIVSKFQKFSGGHAPRPP